MSVKIAIDAMGGDNSPAAEVAGAVAACREWGSRVVLVGDIPQPAHGVLSVFESRFSAGYFGRA